ncbi:Rossmann-like and DUF2520 domain-containing protein [Wenyingzhuangia sp.]|uniref:Rossmann-like and DUF2520 domain-containing protein n=1 Tax=Wenyingzhuangia sp. TaxID=1964193 RepID=UPI00321A66CA
MFLFLTTMIRIGILGTGKVATHLIKGCAAHPSLDLIEIYNRSENGLMPFKDIAPTTTDLNSLKKADLYIVALPDEGIKNINLLHTKGLVVHTSGTNSFRLLQANRRGVLYPAQSFSKEKKIDLTKTPLCIETEKEEDFEILKSFAQLISKQVHPVAEDKRQKLHLAAVFANNFSNSVIGMAYDICKDNDLDFKILQPLLQETFLKTQILSPKSAQTGPAVRNDVATLKQQLNQLSGTQKEVYQILTKSIQENHGSEL